LGDRPKTSNSNEKWRSRMQQPVERDVLNKSENVVMGDGCPGRWTNMMALILAMVFTLWVPPVWSQDSNPKDLKAFYQQNCVRCHGPDGSAVSADGKQLRGQDFTDQEWRRATGDDDMVDTILNGKFFGLAMPKYKDALTKEEALWIVKNVIRKSKKGQIIAPEVTGAGKK